MDYLSELPSWPFTIIAALVAILGAFQVQRFISFRTAAEKFRKVVHESLVGIYPSTAFYIGAAEKNRITQTSINHINSAGSEFSHYISIFRKSRFTKTLAKYCETARQIDWQSDAAFNMYKKTMSQVRPSEISPGEEFRRVVKHLLTFANEK